MSYLKEVFNYLSGVFWLRLKVFSPVHIAIIILSVYICVHT